MRLTGGDIGKWRSLYRRYYVINGVFNDGNRRQLLASSQPRERSDRLTRSARPANHVIAIQQSCDYGLLIILF